MLVPDSQFSQNQTQTQQTQPQTQQHSQPFPRGVWGVLVSCAPQIPAGSAQDYVERPARVELIVGKDSYTIGRDPRSDIILAGKKISAKQARIYVLEDGGLRLEDTSTNGTYVRGSRVGKKNTTTLLNGDEIVFGPATSSLLNDFRYIFQSPSTNPPAFHTTESPSGINVLYDLRGATKIGKGSFATVYSVIRRLDGTKVAVKIIQKKRFRDQPKTMAMLRREIEVLKLLNHVRLPHPSLPGDASTDDTMRAEVLRRVFGFFRGRRIDHDRHGIRSGRRSARADHVKARHLFVNSASA